MKTKQELAGIYVASITAYDQAGNVDVAALQKLMQRNINEGAAGFFVGGSSGECFMLTEAERVQVFEAAAAYAGKTNLIAHVGAIGTAEAVRYAKAAMGMGYDVVAATAPFYYGFSPKEVCRYYYDIAEASGSPVLIYNFPGNTHREFDVANPDYIQLFKSGAILGVKQTNYNLFQMERILNLNPDLIAFDGYDETMVAGQALGSSGSIGSTFNMMLPHYKKIFDLAINNSAEDPSTLSTGGHDPSTEFTSGKAAFFFTGSWDYATIAEAQKNTTMIPYYCGVSGEEKAGLNSGTENRLAINDAASDEDKKATMDFWLWMVTDPEASKEMVAQLGVLPYTDAAKGDNGYLNKAEELSKAGNYTMDWATNYQPNVDQYRKGLVSALNAYTADQSDANWDNFKTAFVDGWAQNYKVENA